MKKIRSALLATLVCLMIGAGAFGLTACSDLVPGLQGEQGIQGEQGEKGEDGKTPVITIGENGNWFIDGVDTNVSATGEKGEQGVGIDSVKFDENGKLVITLTDGTSQTVEMPARENENTESLQYQKITGRTNIVL